jgi:hypothetical protein
MKSKGKVQKSIWTLALCILTFAFPFYALRVFVTLCLSPITESGAKTIDSFAGRPRIMGNLRA